eukprot:scaffold6440_cov94-Skeletonema_marinoi.AAC.3
MIIPLTASHSPRIILGDIGYYEGQLYTGVEWFDAGRGQDIQIVLYGADTLDYSHSVPWNADSGQVECSAITIDVHNDSELVWMSDWFIPTTSTSMISIMANTWESCILEQHQNGRKD